MHVCTNMYVCMYVFCDAQYFCSVSLNNTQTHTYTHTHMHAYTQKIEVEVEFHDPCVSLIRQWVGPMTLTYIHTHTHAHTQKIEVEVEFHDPYVSLIRQWVGPMTLLTTATAIVPTGPNTCRSYWVAYRNFAVNPLMDLITRVCMYACV
jgi:hypothetical protein